VIEDGGASLRRAANAIGVPPNRIRDIAHDQRNITPGTAVRLARHSID
jgi:plasmid maintenance system antidote protein VapI